MPSAVRSVPSVPRAVVPSSACPPRRRPSCSLAALEPDEALAACRGAALAWAVGALPGTRLFLVGGSLVAGR